jgi:hypothetical protein
MILLVILLAFLQLGDMLTTQKILSNGGKELNPIMNWLFTKFGINKVLIIKAIVVTIIGIMFYNIMPIVLIPVCLLYVAVVVWNTHQIFKVKK